MSDAPKWEDVSDWSGLPEVYLTKVQRQQGMFWRVEACSVPMAIGPEVPLVVRHPAVLAELPEVKALIAAAVEGAAQHIVSEAEKLAEGEPSAAPALAFLTELADEVRASIPADAKAALDAYVASKLAASEAREALKSKFSFENADWYWRTMDPDDCGDNPEEAVNRGMVGLFCVCEIACSFSGPTRFGFIAPVLDPESDDEEFLHFATQQDAIDAAKARAALQYTAPATGEQP